MGSGGRRQATMPRSSEVTGRDRLGGVPVVVAEFLANPGARWVVRSRRLSSEAFDHVAGRIRRGLRFGVAARVEDDRGRVLLVRMHPRSRWTPNWLTPGGGDESGETPRQAILREISEEAGIRVTGLRLWRVYHETLRAPDGRSVDWAFLQYTARWAGGRPHSHVPDEISEVRWFRRLPPNMEFRSDWLRRPPAPGRSTRSMP